MDPLRGRTLLTVIMDDVELDMKGVEGRRVELDRGGRFAVMTREERS